MLFYIMLVVLLSCFLWICGGTNNKKIAAAGSAAILSVIAGLRYEVGTDYPVYMSNYFFYKSAKFEGLKYAGIYLTARIAELIRDDYATWFFLMSCLTVGVAVYAIYKYNDDFCLGILLYLFLGCWHNSFNVVKQCAAVSILLLGQKYLLNRNFAKWVLVCIIAASFHISALLMIPVYFFVTHSVTWKQIVIVFFASILISLSYDKLMNVMMLLKGLDKTDVTQGVASRGVNIIRVIVNFAPLALVSFFRRNCTREDRKWSTWSNMSILNAALYFAGMHSVYLTRFCLYTEAFNIFLIPNLLAKSKNVSNKRIIQSMALLLYFMFWLYDLQKGSTTATFHWIFER